MSLVRKQLVALAAGLVLLSGCGTDTDSASDPGSSASESSAPADADTDTTSPTPSPSATPDPAADAPACDDVWQQDARLPRAYKGCADGTGGAGSFVPRQVLPCSSGQRIVTYDDHYWAVLGGTIHRTESRLTEDRAYGDAVARCRG